MRRSVRAADGDGSSQTPAHLLRQRAVAGVARRALLLRNVMPVREVQPKVEGFGGWACQIFVAQREAKTLRLGALAFSGAAAASFSLISAYSRA